MVPGAEFDGWQWVAFVLVDAGHLLGRLAVPPGHAREPAPRRDHDGHAGVARHARGVGCGRSVALVFLGAADASRRHVDGRAVRRRRRRPHVYFETAARDRHAAPARASTSRRAPARRSGDALRALLELGAKTARLENGDEVPVDAARGRRPLRRAAGREDRDRRRRRRRRVGGRRVDAHRRAGAGRRRPRRRGLRRHGQHQRPARRRGDPGRQRHRAGPDRAGWSRRPRARRRRCSGWPTASRRCSCRSCS